MSTRTDRASLPSSKTPRQRSATATDPARLNGLLPHHHRATFAFYSPAEAEPASKAARLGTSEAAPAAAHARRADSRQDAVLPSAAGNVLSPDGAELSRRSRLQSSRFVTPSTICAVEGSVTGQVVVGSLPLARTLPATGRQRPAGPYPTPASRLSRVRRSSLLGHFARARPTHVGALRTKAVPEDIVEETLFFDPFAIVLERIIH